MLWWSLLQGIEQEPGIAPETASEDEVEHDFLDYKEIENNSKVLETLAKGWTAYLVAVLPATQD